ncbi:MAG: ABC transporter permease [Gemmatimonadales bacterium]
MIDERLPLLAHALFGLFGGDDADTLRGDLVEHYHRMRTTRGAVAARRALLADTIRSLFAWWQPSAIRRRRRVRSATRNPEPSSPMFRDLLSDTRASLRALARRPAFTAIVVVTLGLGIGATTTIYSVVDAVVVRALPYRHAEELLAVGNIFPGREWSDEGADLQHLAGVSLKNFEDWRARARMFSDLAAVEMTGALLPDQGNGPELVPMGMVTEGFFSLFQVPPVQGRTFLPEDYAGSNGNVVIVSHSAWLTRFGGDPSVIGKPLSTLGKSSTIVGVLPADFVQPEMLGQAPIEFWAPIDATHPRYESRGRRSLNVFGRLAQGATLAAARAELDGIQAQLAVEYPDGNVYPDGTHIGAGANSLHADTVGSSRQALVLFFAAAALLLLIAGLNAANLLLVRGLDRQSEMSIRGALGAGRAPLARALLIESVLLSLGGGVLGIALAVVGVQAFRQFAPHTLPRLAEVAVNLRIIAICTAVSLGAGLLVGMVIPAVRLTGRDLLTTIRSHMGSTTTPAGTRLRSALVVTQLAVAVVLVVGAGLLFNSFLRVTMVDPGFHPEGLSSFAMPLKRRGHRRTSPSRWRGMASCGSGGGAGPERRRCRVGACPSSHPMGPRVLLPGESADHRREGVAGYVITPNFFDVAAIPIRRGRAFTTADASGSDPGGDRQRSIRADAHG